VSDYSVARSMHATTAAAAAQMDRRRAAHPNGWWGMVVFVATEATLFGTLVGTYFYLRFRSPHWPPAGAPEPHLTLPLVLTGVLVLTSVPVQLAFAAARRARAGAAWMFLALALVVQAGYFAMQMHLFVHDAHLFPPRETAYASIYFTLLGAHHFHVAIGMLLEAWLLLRLLGGLTNYRLIGLQATSFYWHFVNVLAIVVVLTQLSPRV
jgi:heme/copper-type cytochrome/quinol oxidase subunit 3